MKQVAAENLMTNKEHANLKINQIKIILGLIEKKQNRRMLVFQYSTQ